MNKILCPSMMCANFAHLEKEIFQLEEAGSDIFHLDVMDGSFVPNFGMGLQDVEYICKRARIPCDVHLMIENPGNYVEMFAKLGAEIIYVHPESDKHIVRTLQKIIDAGAKPGIAINPGTSFESVKDILNICDYVMLMSVNPGFSGQKYIDFVTPKFKEFVDQANKYGNYHVMIDGACSPEKIRELSNIGVEGFILGTSTLFGKDKSYKQIFKELKKL